MPLDTRPKRSSALMLNLPFGRIWPKPDGTLATQADRQHMAYFYAFALTLIAAAPWYPGLTTKMRMTGCGA